MWFWLGHGIGIALVAGAWPEELLDKGSAFLWLPLWLSKLVWSMGSVWQWFQSFLMGRVQKMVRGNCCSWPWPMAFCSIPVCLHIEYVRANVGWSHQGVWGWLLAICEWYSFHLPQGRLWTCKRLPKLKLKQRCCFNAVNWLNAVKRFTIQAIDY